MIETKQALKIYKEKRFKVISEKMIEVDDKLVTRQTKKGRLIFTCSCENSGMFAQSQICRHKKFFIMYPLIKELNKKIEKKKEFYKGAKLLKKEVNPDYIIDDLNGLVSF